MGKPRQTLGDLLSDVEAYALADTRAEHATRGKSLDTLARQYAM